MDRFSKLVQYASQVAGASTASVAMVELQALAMLSTWVNFWRIRVQEGAYKTTFPSTLTLVEAPTGTGKNAAYRFMQRYVFGFPFRQMEQYLFEEECAQRDTFVKQTNEKYPVTDGAADAKQNEKERERAIKRYDAQKRALSIITPDDGSYEGFAFDRAYLGALPYGAPTIRVDEYGDKLTLMKRAAYLQSFYNRMLELVDYDELTAKSIKDRGAATPGSKGMGITLYFTLAHPDQRQKEDIKRAVLKSIGRRGFLIRESNETVQLRDVTPPAVEDVDVFSNEVSTLTEFMHNRYKDTPPQGQRVIDLHPAARAWYDQWSARAAADLQVYRDQTAPSEHKDLLCALQSDLDRKLLKVATLLAVFNHGDTDFSVTLADMQQAEGIVRRSFESAKRFFDESAYTNTNQVISFLQNKGTPGASALDLMDLPTFRGIPKRSFQEPVYDLMMSEVAPEARTLGLVIEHFRVRKRDFYRCRLATADDAFLDTPEPDDSSSSKPQLHHAFSYRPGLDPSQSEGFQVSTDRQQLLDIVKGEYLYSAVVFAGGKRKQENFQEASLVILDFDDGPSIAEVQEMFKEYSYVLATTKSHQQEKGGVVHDRFRLILPGDYTFTARAEFRQFMQAMTERYNSDPACKDAARTYFGTPGATVLTNAGRAFPVQNMLTRVHAAARLAAAKEPNRNAQQHRRLASRENSMENFTLYDSRGTAHDAVTFIEQLSADDSTTACRCPFPGHQDSHASAFVSHRSNGGLQVSCSVCGLTKFIRT